MFQSLGIVHVSSLSHDSLGHLDGTEPQVVAFMTSFFHMTSESLKENLNVQITEK